MTPCPNCQWPHHSAKPIAIPCAKCGTLVVIGEVPPEQQHAAAERSQQRREKQQRDSRLIGWVKLFRTPDDRGLGDTVERLLARAGARKIKSWLERVGIDCGCTGRQKWLNEQHPYPKNP
jgi:uncharacterized Zn finger protein (UPF0148 family)